jgi:hypothetical protein
MAARYPNPRCVRTHQNYTVEELAKVAGVHKHTVRRWVKNGLVTVDDRRPTIIRGADARLFLEARKTKKRHPCRPGEIYCFKCRVPRTPAGNFAELQVSSPTNGRLIGICPECSTMLHRIVNPTKLEPWNRILEIAVKPAPARIADSPDPKLNADSEEVSQT